MFDLRRRQTLDAEEMAVPERSVASGFLHEAEDIPAAAALGKTVAARMRSGAADRAAAAPPPAG